MGMLSTGKKRYKFLRQYLWTKFIGGWNVPPAFKLYQSKLIKFKGPRSIKLRRRYACFYKVRVCFKNPNRFLTVPGRDVSLLFDKKFIFFLTNPRVSQSLSLTAVNIFNYSVTSSVSSFLFR
jgi:hypothetical protein